MAYYFDEPSRTFNEYLLVPGYSSCRCIPQDVSLKTPRGRSISRGEEPAISMNIPHGVRHHAGGVRRQHGHRAWRREGGLSFIYGSQTDREPGRPWSRSVKDYKAGFVSSDSNVAPGS